MTEDDYDPAADSYLSWLDAVAAMRAAGAPGDYSTASPPLLALIEQLSKRKQATRVYLTRNGFSLRMERGSRS